MTRAAALALVAALACEAAAPRPAAVDPSPDACAGCHAEVVAAWRGSMHAHAWDDPVFRREYDPQPLAACRDCHAPPGSAPGRTTGIDCAACHVRGGEILASTVSAAGAAAHPLRRAPELRAPEFCGACHQFNFLADGRHAPDEALQDTLAEHRASDAYRRGRTCVDCHMPGASHAFPGIHDPAQLARAVTTDVVARRVGDDVELTVTIAGDEIGHAFPTGDVFRQAVLRVSTPGGAHAEVTMRRWLARTAGDGEDDELLVRTVDDTRVPPPGQGALRETLVLRDPQAREVAWELVLHRVPPGRAAAAGLAPEVVTRPVARGQARWLDAPAP